MLAYIDPAGEWPKLSSVVQVRYARHAGVGMTEQRYQVCRRRLTVAEFRQRARFLGALRTNGMGFGMQPLPRILAGRGRARRPPSGR